VIRVTAAFLCTRDRVVLIGFPRRGIGAGARRIGSGRGGCGGGGCGE
jgi:hypothetical protein